MLEKQSAGITKELNNSWGEVFKLIGHDPDVKFNAATLTITVDRKGGSYRPIDFIKRVNEDSPIFVSFKEDDETGWYLAEILCQRFKSNHQSPKLNVIDELMIQFVIDQFNNFGHSDRFAND